LNLPRKRTLRWQAWWPILALVLQALAPLLAQAAPAQPGHAIEICTATGIKTVHADEGGGAPAQSKPAAHEHCLLCNLSGQKPLPPAQDIAGLSPGPAAELRLPPSTASPAALPASFFTVLLSRAPPTLS
jgi:hypothetical protein